MRGVWKNLFVAVVVLLVLGAAAGGYCWYRLEVALTRLAETELQLADAELRLADTELRLADTVAELGIVRQQLSDTAAVLNTTRTELIDAEAELSAVKTQLNTTENELSSARIRLETVESENARMLGRYAGLRSQIDARLRPTPQEKQGFVTPDNSLVSARVQEITGDYSGDVSDYWRDCERLYRWVTDNISYSYDSYMPALPEDMSGELVWWPSCWRMPEDTLTDETGDCEDMAVLLASMLQSYNQGQYAVWVVVIRSSTQEVPGHAAVAFPVAGGNLTILDPAGHYYTGGPYWSLRSERAAVAIRDWLSYWEDEIPGVEVVEAFSGAEHHQFSGTTEFLAWLAE